MVAAEVAAEKPAPELSHAALKAKAAIAAAIKETGAASPKDMGKVMGLLKQKFAGQMDFGKASGLVKDMLKG